MAAGYQVLDSEGTTSAGTGQADATRWLEGFDRLRSSHDGYRLLYGTLTLLPWFTTARRACSMMRQTPTSWWNRPDRCHFSCSQPEGR